MRASLSHNFAHCNLSVFRIPSQHGASGEARIQIPEQKQFFGKSYVATHRKAHLQ
jgi:hypothetical protein